MRPARVIATIFLTIIFSIIATANLQADEKPQDFVDLNQPIPPSTTASFQITNLKIDKARAIAGEQISGSFTITNVSGINVYDGRYKIMLVGNFENGIAQTAYDQIWNSEGQIPTLKDQSINLNFDYKLPQILPTADLVLRIQSTSGIGDDSGWEDTSLSVFGAGNFVEIDKTFLSDGERNVHPDAGVYFEPGEQAIAKFTASNTSTTRLNLTPKIKVYNRNTNQKLLIETSTQPITLSPQQQKPIELNLPKFDQPGSYLAVVQLYDGNKAISPMPSFRYVVKGLSARILTITADKSKYSKNEIAQVTITYAGPLEESAQNQGEGILQVVIENSQKFAETSEKISLNSGASKTLMLRVSKDVIEPKITAKILKDDNLLDSYTTKIQSSRVEKPALLPRLIAIISLVAILILAIIVGLIYKFKFKNRLVVFILISFGLFASALILARHNIVEAIDCGGTICADISPITHEGTSFPLKVIWNRPVNGSMYRPADEILFSGALSQPNCGNSYIDHFATFKIISSTGAERIIGSHSGSGSSWNNRPQIPLNLNSSFINSAANVVWLGNNDSEDVTGTQPHGDAVTASVAIKIAPGPTTGLSVTKPACSSGNYTVTFNWQANPLAENVGGQGAYWIDVSKFSNFSSFANKNVFACNPCSTSSNGGWNNRGSGLVSAGNLLLDPQVTYYWRIFTQNRHPGSGIYDASITNFATPQSFSVPSCAAPVSVSITASPPNINRGNSSTLTIIYSNAHAVTVDNGVGIILPLTAAPQSGSVTRIVSPTTTTTYTATATHSIGGSVTDSATVTVTQPDFTIGLSPPSQSVAIGTRASYTVTLAPVGNWNGNISLSRAFPALGTIPGLTFSFDANPIFLSSAGPATTSLHIDSIAGTTPAGTFGIIIAGSGTSAGVSQTHASNRVSLTLLGGSPFDLQVLGEDCQDDGKVDISLGWSAPPTMTHFTVEISPNPLPPALDSASIVAFRNHTFTNLEPNTHYHWRVRGENPALGFVGAWIASEFDSSNCNYQIEISPDSAHNSRFPLAPGSGHNFRVIVNFNNWPADVNLNADVCDDLNGDGAVAAADIFILVPHFGETPASPGWDPIYDLNENGAIDASDITILLGQFGVNCSAISLSWSPAGPPPVSPPPALNFRQLFVSASVTALEREYSIVVTGTSGGVKKIKRIYLQIQNTAWYQGINGNVGATDDINVSREPPTGEENLKNAIAFSKGIIDPKLKVEGDKEVEKTNFFVPGPKTYNDFKVLFGQNISPHCGPPLNVAPGRYNCNSDLTISTLGSPPPAPPEPKVRIFFIEGDLTINTDINKPASDQPLVYVVEGDVKIDQNVTRVEAYFIVDGTFYSRWPERVNTNPPADQILEVLGGVAAHGTHPPPIGQTKAFSLSRNLLDHPTSPACSAGIGNSSCAAEVFEFDPSLLVYLRKELSVPSYNWQETAP